jgi:uncharacterized LabA/DUF88 family protein
LVPVLLFAPAARKTGQEEVNILSEDRLKIAVFIDFDNIAIGVKQSLNRNFDVGTVLEAIKERGEVVTKIAYGDWKRSEDFSRGMTQHAVHMVQRNLTPGGDKNGADIALALDALEMAFTRNHINAFVIVGGDSDFIALVEKLKQYDKTVFIVGGRAFTSAILQKNCHEFIAYENLVGVHPGTRKISGKTQPASTVQLASAMPLIRRALKVLSDREVSPQLGLLKSTLLQLDSTFSERDHGVSSFREFIQKLADAGHVNLKQVDRSLLVELKEVEPEDSDLPAAIPGAEPQPLKTEPLPSPTPQSSDAVKALQEILRGLKSKPHWPMYLRGFKQFLKSLQPSFDEHAYGISSIYDLVRQAQREGMLRVERNRQGILRIFPGERFPEIGTERSSEGPRVEEPVMDQSEEATVEALALPETGFAPPEEEPLIIHEMQAESEVQPLAATESPEVPAREIEPIAKKPASRKRARSTASASRTARARKSKSSKKGATTPAKTPEPDSDVPF